MLQPCTELFPGQGIGSILPHVLFGKLSGLLEAVAAGSPNKKPGTGPGLSSRKGKSLTLLQDQFLTRPGTQNTADLATFNRALVAGFHAAFGHLGNGIGLSGRPVGRTQFL